MTTIVIDNYEIHLYSKALSWHVSIFCDGKLVHEMENNLWYRPQALEAATNYVEIHKKAKPNSGSTK